MRPFSSRATGVMFVGESPTTVRKNGFSDARGARAFLCAGFLLACSSIAASAGAQTVVPTDLGTLGGTYSVALDVSSNGQVVGYATTAGNAATHAFSWTQLGGMVDLGTLGGTYRAATAVSANGQVVGYATTAGDAADRKSVV